MSATSDYVAMNENGEIINEGDMIGTFDGQSTIFRKVTRAPEAPSTGRVLTDLGEHFPGVYGLVLVKGETEAQKVAQRAADLHYDVSSSEDAELSTSDQPVYKASKSLLLHALMTGYGLSRPKAEQVYTVIIVNGDTVADAVHTVATTKPADLPKL